MTTQMANQFIQKWNNTFAGSPLYGESLMTKLGKIEVEKMQNLSSKALNQIAQQVQHIIYWRIFTIDKLQNTNQKNEQKDWSEISIDSLKDWQKLMAQLQDSQKSLVELLRDKTDDFLLQNIPNRKYSYIDLIEGIIQHDVYHTGQIGLIGKQLGDAEEGTGIGDSEE